MINRLLLSLQRLVYIPKKLSLAKIYSLLPFLFFLLTGSVIQAQNPPLVKINGPQVLCAGACDTLYAAISNANLFPPPYTYSWTGPNNFSSAQSLIIICPVETGTYTVVVNNIEGVSASATYTVYVLPYQPLQIVSSNPAPCNFDSSGNICEKVCPNTTVTYSAQALNSSQQLPLIWQVTGASSYTVNNHPFSNSVTVNWGVSGNGSVSVHTESAGGPVSGGGCGGEAALCVTIIDAPLAKFSTDPPSTAGLVTVCKGQTVYFDNHSTGADYYEWAFSDDISTSAAAEPQHVFQTPGNFTVRLIARSSCLCSDTTLLNVEVLDAVSPTLDCVGTICPHETVTYTASNGCTPFTWSVSPNGTVLNGGTANVDTITVQWANGPSGTITLGAQPCSGAVCPQPAIIHVPIISDDAEIRGKERVCPAAEEVYAIEPYGGTGFVWSLSGGGTIKDGQGTDHVTISWTAYPNPTVTYWLSVKYDNCYLGCGGEDSIAVHILSPFNLSGPIEACVGADGSFISKLTTPIVNLQTNWTLVGPNGSTAWTSAAPSANVTAPFTAGDGVYRMLAVPADLTKTCSDEASWAIRVAAQPDQPTGIFGPVNICSNNSYTYEALGTTPDNNLQWTVQNGASAPTTFAGNPLNIAWGASGPYSLIVRQVSTNGLGCLSDTARLDIAAIGGLTISGDDIVCEDLTAQYALNNLEGTDIQWSINPTTAGAIANGQGTTMVDIFWTQAGGHVLSANVCGQMTTFPVTVLATPDPMVQAPANVCAGQTGAVQTVNPYTAYVWRSAAGGSLSTSPTLNLGNGSYSVQVTDGQGCVGTSEFTIGVSPAPNLNITTGDFTGFCNNSNFVMISALTNSDGNFQYQWFQNGLPVGGNTPTYTTNQYGFYTAVVTNQFGCTASDGPIAIVDDCGGGPGGGPPGTGPFCPPGSINLASMPTTQCDSFNFQVSGPQYAAGSASWIFAESGAGILGGSSLDNPGFHFQNAGQYIVVVTAQLLNGTVCRVIDSVKVVASAQFSPTPACPGAASAFKDESTFLPGGGISNWAWDFGDPASGAANVSAVRNASHAYTAGGNYPVTLTVTANSGCTSAETLSVPVPTAAPPNFALPPQNCEGNALGFAAVVGPEVTNIVWDFGQPATGPANDATGTPAYHSFMPAGSYSVTATSTNAFGCTAVFSQNVTIAPNLLTGTISPANPAPICEGSTITLTAPPGGIAWAWSDTITTTESFVANKEGTYRVTITDANGCTYSPPPVKVEVNPSPDALIKALLENALGQIVGTSYPTLSTCDGEDVHLVVQGNGGNYGYVWSDGNGTDDEVFFTEDRNSLLSVGDHFYTVTVTDHVNGCTAVTAPFVVSVNPVPSGFNITANGVCAQSATMLTYNGSSPANWQFIWNNGQAGTSLTAKDPGLYFIRVINEFGCEAKSNNLYIQPGPPVGSIPGGCHTRCRPDTLCLPPNLPAVTSWQWYYNGSPIPGATGADLVATESGVYWAVLTDGFGCEGQSDPLSLHLFDAYGNVTGKVWADVNNNGMIDVADTLVSGIPVDLYQNGNPVAYGQSNAGGSYAFTNILSANYTVQIDPFNLPGNWQVVIGQKPANMSGCQTVATADLLLKFVCQSLSSSLQLQACPGGSAMYQNTAILTGSTQYFTFTNAQGCDSIVTVTVQALPTSVSALKLQTCPGSTVSYGGMQLSPGIVQDFVLQNHAGCDSTVTVTVQALPTSASALTLTTCPGTPVTYEGSQLTAGTVQDFVFQNSVGCDSTVTVTVQALQNSTSALTLTTCPGTPVAYGGQQLNPGTVQDIVIQNYQGCDSTVTVTVMELPVSASSLTLQGCPGSTVGYNGLQLMPGTVQDVVFENYLGCDSTVTVTVETLQNSASWLEVSVCPGETFEYANLAIPAGQSQEFHLMNAEGCDSLVTVVVTAYPIATFALLVDSSCATQSTGSITVHKVAGGLVPYQFSLDGGSIQTDSLFDNLGTGQYEVLLEDGNGCTVTQSALVDELPRLGVVLPNGILPCDSSGIRLAPVLSGDTIGLQLKWWNGAISPFTTAIDAGPVWVEATNRCETVHSDAAVVWAEPGADISFVYVPNVFAPTARDYANTVFRPSFASGLTLLRYHMEVFDRWGNLMFRSEQVPAGWEGNFRNDIMKPGVFVWYLEADIAFCGRIITVRKKGDVTIVR